MTSSQLCHRQCCVCCSWSFATWIQQTSFQHEIAEDVGLCVAAVAADGGDELLHAVLGAAVAGGPWLVLQPRILLAGPHAHAGASPAAFHPACLYHDDQIAIIQMRLWICFMLFIPACTLQTYDVFEGQVHACPAATTLCFQANLEDAVALWSWLQASLDVVGLSFAHLQHLVLWTLAHTNYLPVTSARDRTSNSVSISCTYFSICAFIVNDQEHAALKRLPFLVACVA